MAQDALQTIAYDGLPSVLVLADSDAGLGRLTRAAEEAGCRVSDAVPFESAHARLDRQVAVDAVLLSVEEDHGALLDRLMEKLEDGAESSRFRSVVAAPAELIDPLFARAPHAGVIQLCGPSAFELVAAIASASVRRPLRLNDSGKGTARLQQLSEEVGRIASILAHLSEDDAHAASLPGQEEEGEPLTAASVRTMIRARRLRERYFPGDLFADPAWDMLLDLMAARLEGQKVAVSSLCIAAAVPATTALRWIKTLTDHGLFVRVADPQDGRRVHRAQRGRRRAARRLSCGCSATGAIGDLRGLVDLSRETSNRLLKELASAIKLGTNQKLVRRLSQVIRGRSIQQPRVCSKPAAFPGQALLGIGLRLLRSNASPSARTWTLTSCIDSVMSDLASATLE